MLDERPCARSVRKPWLLGLALVGLLTLSATACNTAQGFGEDVQSAGDTISDTAEDVKDEMD